MLCTVNVQHNCARNRCDTSATAPVFQERERTTMTRAAIRHTQPRDVILNTMQMRDARYLQPLARAAQRLDRNAMILAGAHAEFEARKATMSKSKAPRGSRARLPVILAKSLLGQTTMPG